MKLHPELILTSYFAIPRTVGGAVSPGLLGVHVDHTVRVVREFELTGELLPVNFKLFVVPFLRALKIFQA